MRREISIYALVLLLFGLCASPCYGQKGGNDGNPESDCLSPSTLLSFVHLSFSEAFDRLDSMGFNLGDLGDQADTLYDTIDYFTVSYQKSIFFSRNNKGCYILFMESLDGLGNIIEYTLTPKGTCNVLAELSSSNYIYNKEKSSYSGTIPMNGQVEKFEIAVKQDYALWMRCMRTDDVPDFISRKKDTARAVIKRTVNRALQLSDAERFVQAYAALDSMRDYYPPMNEDLDKCRERITKQREQMYSYRLSGAVELMDYPAAIALCDTILTINPKNEKVRHTRELIYAQLGQKSQHFQAMCPEQYDSIRTQLERIINTDIRSHQSTSSQQIKMNFRIYTNKTNESGGQIELVQGEQQRKAAQQNKARQEMLQRAIDNVAASPLIQPVMDNGIYVITQDDMETDVSWSTSTIRINSDEAKGQPLLDKYVDTIERMFFYHKKPSRTELNEDGSVKMVSIPSLPTKKIYTFSVTLKESYNQTYSDISLVGFETARGGSWLPSLLLPGLGTYMQEARGDVISRALPFFLFAGISAAGYIYQQNKGGENAGEDANWGQQNVGNIVFLTAGGISAAIYFNDLFEAIGNTFKNTKRSKSIRKRLKEGPLELQMQDVPVSQR